MIEKAEPKNKFQEIYINKIKEDNILQKNYKREPYPYQKDNINWMKFHEENINNNKTISTYLLSDNVILSAIEQLNEPFILDLEKNANVKITVGVLADEIGLGKTLSMIGLIAEKLNPNNYPSLVLCPSRLCKQWDQEIQSTYEMKTCIIGTIRQFDKLKKKSIQ